MRLFFTSPENISDDEVTLSGSDVAHIRSVLRLKPGDGIYVADGRGLRYHVELTQVKRDTVKGNILSGGPFQIESPLSICMGLALTKGGKFDGILRQSVELGVNVIVPMITGRCVVKLVKAEREKKIRRWQRVVREAAKQCGRSAVPEVRPIALSVKAFCSGVSDYDIKLAFWEEEEKRSLKDLAGQDSPRSAVFLCGPEGGFTEEEMETARGTGFVTVSLGPRVLRAETAPIAILTLLQNLWGDI
ncbi:MAG: 16S rRNA (uracil(1498)-N(3))-methyltransferase [Nitrospinaceae bacterium]